MRLPCKNTFSVSLSFVTAGDGPVPSCSFVVPLVLKSKGEPQLLSVAKVFTPCNENPHRASAFETR
jgi:hypothetical protein